VYVLIDAIDTTHRAHELPCNADFWLAVQQELLPLVKAIAPFSDRADRTVVAGQSFGGFPRCMPDCTGLNALAVY
jgi:enterochelin esterase family protein